MANWRLSSRQMQAATDSVAVAPSSAVSVAGSEAGEIAAHAHDAAI